MKPFAAAVTVLLALVRDRLILDAAASLGTGQFSKGQVNSRISNLSLGLAFTAMLGLAGCATVDSRIAGNRDAYDSWPMEIREKIAAGQIDLGFTRDQVRVAVGEPDRTFVRSTADGPSEVWSYRDRRPRIGFGIGVGFGGFSGSRGVTGGVGIGTGGGYHDDERLGVVFDATGQVTVIEVREN